MEARESENSETLLEAIRLALTSLALIQDVVSERLEHEHFLALSDAQEVLAVAYTRAGGEPLKGVCAMCGRRFPEGPEHAGTICGYCERSYGPESQDE